VAGAPFSGVEVRTSQQALANGTLIQHQDQTKISRDSQGRTRRESTHQTPDGKTVTRVSISDPVAGMMYELDTTNKIAYSHPGHFPSGTNSTQSATRQPAQAQANANIKREALATQSVNGVTASGTRITHTIPAGTIGNSAAIQTVHETWMADDLKIPVKTSMTDPRTGTSTMEMTNLLRGEPDASLFVVPSDYTVKKGGPGPMGGRGPRPGAQAQSKQ
jgi:hypothetical protein